MGVGDMSEGGWVKVGLRCDYEGDGVVMREEYQPPGRVK